MLASKHFGPYQIVDKVEKEAYRLLLPLRSKGHPTFHVSQLKKHVGHATTQASLCVVDDHGAWVKEVVRILDHRIGKRGNMATIEVLVEWINSFPEDATWETWSKLKVTYPQFNP